MRIASSVQTTRQDSKRKATTYRYRFRHGQGMPPTQANVVFQSYAVRIPFKFDVANPVRLERQKVLSNV